MNCTYKVQVQDGQLGWGEWWVAIAFDRMSWQGYEQGKQPQEPCIPMHYKMERDAVEQSHIDWG